jgi:hypothetical protein
MKVVYIAHPVGGDVEENLNKIKRIVRLLNLSDPEIVPFVPYFVDVCALNDSEPEERARGVKNNTALLKAGFVNEVWLYGGRISDGMQKEIDLAEDLNIPVIDKDNCFIK